MNRVVGLWLTVAPVALVAGGCFSAAPESAPLRCFSADECPSPLLCAVEIESCVNVDSACIIVDGVNARLAADGSVCDDGICARGECAPARCGDGIVSEPERCDGDAGCRADCTKCGDGVVDDGEACDDGAANSDTRAGACRTTCRIAACGDGVRDPGEGCDEGDRNDDVAEGACRTSCTPAMNREGVVDTTSVAGVCGRPGNQGKLLFQPAAAMASTLSGAIYVSDAGNHRVVRVDEHGALDVVIGDGTPSSAGDGGPARAFPIRSPGQLILDDHGNLIIASTTGVSVVVNGDGGSSDADGDDNVVTIFGGGARDAYPESDTFCINSLTAVDDGRVYAADGCQGFLVEMHLAPSPS